MIKAVRKNKNLKWIDSRYARFYHIRVALKNLQIAQILASSIMATRTIRGMSEENRIPKALAISKIQVDSIDIISKMPQVKGRVTK